MGAYTCSNPCILKAKSNIKSILLDNSLLEYGSVVEDAFEREARQVDRAELSVREQFSDGAAGGGRLLQSVTREAVAQHQICDIRVLANNCILHLCIVSRRYNILVNNESF